jgi:hypothetical protein
MSTLEAQLTALTQEFVARLVEAIRNASFAEVANLSLAARSGGAAKVGRGPGRPARAASPGSSASSASSGDGGSSSPRRRHDAASRAEIGERVIRALKGASEPMGVRALSGELDVAPDVLAVPLRELRAAGRIRKHGEKRATTYSVT